MPLRYAIRAADPAAHLFHVTLTVDTPDPQGQRFMLPAWNPGSYMIREFARHIGRLTALAGEGSGARKLAVSKLDKHTWVTAPTDKPVTVAYEVYAWDLSVRAAHLDQTHGFFNGACVFLLPFGHAHTACFVDILPPERGGRGKQRSAQWKVATGLRPARRTTRYAFGRYEARDYDELIDCPVEMGTFAMTSFDVFGTPHDIVVTGQVPKLDLTRLASDLKRVCEQQVALFEPRSKRAPFDRYTFLTTAVGDGYGGLEHRNSTALLMRRADLPAARVTSATEGYRTFLGLASHEYFHSWNVKRIRPQAFIPYALGRENHTRLLWLFEGSTSYYDDLSLVRCGLLTVEQYFATLGKTLTNVLQRSGRLKHSVAESSFDAWMKYYRPDENAPNAVVNYYQKGSLVALALDLSIRAQTAGRRSLDDLMRHFWREYKAAGADYRGVPEDAVADALEQATGVKLARVLREWTEGTRDPDFAALLAPLGLEFEAKPALDLPAFAFLGMTTTREGDALRIASVYDGSPARAAGLSGGDVLVALDGLRVTAGSFDAQLARLSPGDTAEVTAFRRDELMRFTVRLATRPPQKYAVTAATRPTAAALRLQRAWLGQR